jgi:hypothetical protein
VPLFLPKHFIIPFNAKGPKSNAMEKVPTFQPSFVFLMDAMAEDAVVPIEFMEWLVMCPIKLSCQFPCLLSLNAIPKLLKSFTSKGEEKSTLGRNRSGDLSPPCIHCHCMIPNGPNKCCFFTHPSPTPNPGPLEGVSVWDKSAPLVKNGG